MLFVHVFFTVISNAGQVFKNIPGLNIELGQRPILNKKDTFFKEKRQLKISLYPLQAKFRYTRLLQRKYSYIFLERFEIYL